MHAAEDGRGGGVCGAVARGGGGPDVVFELALGVGEGGDVFGDLEGHGLGFFFFFFFFFWFEGGFGGWLCYVQEVGLCAVVVWGSVVVGSVWW